MLYVSQYFNHLNNPFHYKELSVQWKVIEDVGYQRCQ